jgi:uncharacterized protein DUF4189
MKSAIVFAGLFFAAIMLSAAPAAADDYYGAIAFSTESGALGWAYDHASRGAAENDALNRCGSGCEVAIWVKNACAAIATSSNHSYGSGWSTSRGEAERIAVNVCHEHASDCSVERWICTTR